MTEAPAPMMYWFRRTDPSCRSAYCCRTPLPAAGRAAISCSESKKPKLPEDVLTIVAKNINAAAVKEREEVAKLNPGLQQELAGKGLTFNQPNVTPFRDKKASVPPLLCGRFWARRRVKEGRSSPSPLVGEGGFAKRRRVRGLYPRRQTPHPARIASAPPSPTRGEGK